MSQIRPPKTSPPWKVIVLVAHHLDPKTLAIASCVSMSWSISMSSDHLWQPICATHFPSLFNLRAAAATAASIPYRQLYALGHKSTQRRLRSPKKPHLSLNNLTFAVDIHHHHSSPPATLVIPGGNLIGGSNDLFRFDVDVSSSTASSRNNLELVFGSVREIKVTINAVLKGFEGVFTMMDCKGEGSFVNSDNDGWFSEELPMPECCASGVTSGLVAEMRLVLREKVVVKVSIGVLSIISWRYVCVDDVLRYLQHFLILPYDNQM